ncbi:MAG: UDP-3-O-(3-hydroxymyristoyl)glucosamine N-acyltransferase [Porticoccaceae bacterium]
MVSFTLAEVAAHIGAELRGDVDRRVTGLNTLQLAGPEQLSFLANPAYRQYLDSANAAAVIIHPDVADDFHGNALVMSNPYLGYALATQLFDRSPTLPAGAHERAVVAASAKVDASAAIAANAVIGENVVIGAHTSIGPGVVIGDGTVIGEHCRLAANVSIYHGIVIGDHVTIHSGAVIGADGFGFAQKQGRWIKIHQLGSVVIGNRVEIGACTTIDRGALGNTIIEDGVILDNHVQVAHNVQLGENTAMASYAGVAGSTVVGKNCIFAARSGSVGHVTLCDGVHLTAAAVITKSLKEPGSYSSGTMFSQTRDWKKNAVRFNQLDELASRIRELEKKL